MTKFTSFTEHQYYIICHKVSVRLNTFSENVTFLQARGSCEFGTFADNSTHIHIHEQPYCAFRKSGRLICNSLTCTWHK